MRSGREAGAEEPGQGDEGLERRGGPRRARLDARGADVAVALAGLGQERLLDALALDLVLGPVAALAGLTGS